MDDRQNQIELNAIDNIEKACSVLSLLSCFFVIVTFYSFHGFQKPVNRLVLFATFGNMMTNIGTLMSRSYVDSPDSAGCQVQSFLIQMFMPADAFWTFAMAVNIYLTFYHRFDAERLKKMEIPYLLCCFGVPFVPALTFIFVRDGNGQRVYGDARLWCWVSREWHILRIAAFYAPVWVLILATLLIYLRAGHTIYQRRSELQSLLDIEPTISKGHHSLESSSKMPEITVTTQISTAEAETVTAQLQNLGLHGIYAPNEGYFCSISADGQNIPSQQGDIVRTDSSQTQTPTVAPRVDHRPRRQRTELDRAAWSYTKCAALFFTALLITWIPSSANRVYSYVHEVNSLRALELMSAFVLPLQGFWNAVIYAVTSWTACKEAWATVRLAARRGVNRLLLGGRTRRLRHHNSGGSVTGSHHHRGFRLSSSSRKHDIQGSGESESMTELASPERIHAVMRRDS